MATSIEQIDALRLVRSEDEHLEFKAAENRYDFEELVDYCVALANEGGGRMVLGMTDKIPRRVVGTKAFDVPERTVAGIHDRLQLKVTFDEVSHPDGRVLVFHVPSRPKGHPVHYKGKYLMRAGEDLVPMSQDQLRAIFAEGEPDWFTQAAMIGCGDDQVVQLLDTQSYFDLLHLPYPVNRAGVLARLETEKVIEPDGAGWIITNLGAMLFAKQLNAFDRLARKAARVIVYEGKNKLKTKTDHVGDKGYAVGFKELVEYVNGLIPANEVIEEALRREVKMFPEIAVRELIANALIHQDFNESGTSMMIEIYDDRLEISNPGKPFISPERFIDEYQSRNERLADLMRRLGICEEKGSGVDKVIAAAESHELPAPDFRAGESRTTVVLFAHQKFPEMGKEDRIRACYQHCCLQYVSNQKMTNSSLRQRFGLSDSGSSSSTTSQIITATKDAGLIKLDGDKATAPKYARYVPHWA